MSASPEARSPGAASDAAPAPGDPFPWQFTTPLFIGSALNPRSTAARLPGRGDRGELVAWK